MYQLEEKKWKGIKSYMFEDWNKRKQQSLRRKTFWALNTWNAQRPTAYRHLIVAAWQSSIPFTWLKSSLYYKIGVLQMSYNILPLCSLLIGTYIKSLMVILRETKLFMQIIFFLSYSKPCTMELYIPPEAWTEMSWFCTRVCVFLQINKLITKSVFTFLVGFRQFATMPNPSKVWL